MSLSPITSDLNYLLQLKKILIEEIRVLENANANPEYFDSLPIQNSEVRQLVHFYKTTNQHSNITRSIEKKRGLLSQVNHVLKKGCTHRIIDGDFNASYSETRRIKYCVLCMNFFDIDEE